MEKKSNRTRRLRYISRRRAAAIKAAESRWSSTDETVRLASAETPSATSQVPEQSGVDFQIIGEEGAKLHAISEGDGEGLPSSSNGHYTACSPVTDTVTLSVSNITDLHSDSLPPARDSPTLHVSSAHVADASMTNLSGTPSVQGKGMPSTPKGLFGTPVRSLYASTPISDISQLDTSVSSVDGPVYAPNIRQDLLSKKPVAVDKFLFVGESTDLVDQINSSSSCKTAGCKGVLIPHKVVYTGLGGAVEMRFVCNGCWARTLSFCSSTKHVVPRQGRQLTSACTIVSLALQVAHVAFGSAYRQYYKWL